jgi:nucleoside-diphosphate-sugar epimerase
MATMVGPVGTIAVSGTAGHLGPFVLDALAARGPAGQAVMSLDADVVPHLRGVSTVVHLGETPDTRRLLVAADRAAVTTVVLLSGAAVYGAWSDNPVPLPEVAPLRPNPGASWPTELAERERLLAEWRDGADGRRAVVLRPTVIVDGAHQGGPARRLAGLGRVRVRGANRPVQAVHGRDVAAAVALAVAGGLDGAYNVAPDGWVRNETALALVGPKLRVSLPARVAAPFLRLPRGLAPYTVHPWVVANDRLRAAGWVPAFSNEDALLLA